MSGEPCGDDRKLSSRLDPTLLIVGVPIPMPNAAPKRDPAPPLPPTRAAKEEEEEEGVDGGDFDIGRPDFWAGDFGPEVGEEGDDGNEGEPDCDWPDFCPGVFGPGVPPAIDCRLVSFPRMMAY